MLLGAATAGTGTANGVASSLAAALQNLQFGTTGLTNGNSTSFQQTGPTVL
jgi:hypothetical protein